MSLKSKLSLSVMIATAVVLFPAMAMAQDAASNQFDTNSMLAIAAGFAVGLAALGGTLGQGRAAAAALEGISRNPGAAARIQTPMILGLALIESLVLLAWVIAFMLQGQIK
ncbi:ATP synthase F0 subunit C [Chondromyces crocatus]|uniref:ATP synthase subunit c n=1 Tax=Chondromyces crocatus TaxID=52 RepID=A0A0K1E7R9_CHOCO|nr:ATP synthase F0 subunit C [Chondromyces crocatus]AKT36603.1 ATP synthase subunit c [Chondromyces crocatus]